MTYTPGDWKAVCSMCGQTRLASELVKNWQGQWRCREHNEPRHPQEYVRAPAVERPPAFVQAPVDSYAFMDFLQTEENTQDYIVTEGSFDPLQTET